MSRCWTRRDGSSWPPIPWPQDSSTAARTSSSGHLSALDVGAPCLAVIGTGKRIGKTAVSAHAARTLAAAGLAVVVVAMGRGGPAAPTVVDPRSAPLDTEALLDRVRAGLHAASDYLEDAALAGVPTVGARRAGGGLAGTVYDSNVLAAARAAVDLDPDLLVLEGSGAAIPPVASERTVLVTSALRPVTTLTTGLGPYRVLVSDMVVLTMCEPPLASQQQIERTRLALDQAKPGIPVIATVLEPVPAQDVRGARVAYFTTAPAAIHDRLRDTLQNVHGAQVTAVVGSLSDRAALREAIRAPQVQSAEVFLTEIKAAGIDVVAMGAADRRVVFCDNRPAAVSAAEPLEPALERLAREAVAEHA